MKIEFETKLNVGDDIWYMKDNKPVCHKVCLIRVDLMDIDKNYLTPRVNTKYKTTPCLNEVPEYLAFKTKEELVSSL